MHPDRRREGRAIRKARRQRKEVAENYILSGQFGRDVVALANAAASTFVAFGEALAGLGRAMQTPPRRIDVALPPPVSALRRSEEGVPYPTQSGVERAREAHSASAEERIDRAAAELGFHLLPWQREAGAAYLRGEQMVLARGRSGGRYILGAVVEQARSTAADGWLDLGLKPGVEYKTSIVRPGDDRHFDVDLATGVVTELRSDDEQYDHGGWEDR